jgi:lysylphosphatidylglycerol synthase-like protein
MDGYASSLMEHVLERIHSVVATSLHALGLIVDRTAEVRPGLLVAGTVVYFVAQAVRTRGWYTILRAAFPHATDLRARDVTRAYLAGAGVNSVVPARGGDVVKLALVRRRIEGSTYPTLAATFLPETLFETAIGSALVVWALARGFLPVPDGSGELPSFDVSLAVEHPIVALALVVVIGVVVGWAVRRVRDQVRQGLAILGCPRCFICGVASWQALARVIRLGSLALFMEAFGLPVTIDTVVLVMAAQGGGRIIPLAPASAGLRLAMLSYGFVEVTGQQVDIAAITAFTVGVGAVVGFVGLVLGAGILAREVGTLHPRRAMAAVRRRVAGDAWTRSLPASTTTAPSTEASA